MNDRYSNDPVIIPFCGQDLARAKAWDDFVSDLCASHKPWWMDPEDEANAKTERRNWGKVVMSWGF